MQAQLEQLQAKVAAQAHRVRTLKQTGALQPEIDEQVVRLKQLKLDASRLEGALEDSKPLYTKCREPLENLLKRRFFVGPSFEIYGGTAGLFDFGPPGCAVKAEVERLWRRHFVIEEDMMEVSSTCLTPHYVLRASGHADRFTDLMVRDVVTNECYRGDKVIEEWVAKRLVDASLPPLDESQRDALRRLAMTAGALTGEEMRDAIAKWEIKSTAGNVVTDPYPFNLMFHTRIGPKEDLEAHPHVAGAPAGAAPNVGFLRPETAQGIFVNFRRLLEQNGGRMPFAAAQLGLAFRNEIAPRNGLLRVREFPMAEIEHFVHPLSKRHRKFESVKEMQLPLFSKRSQLTDGKVIRDMSLDTAISEGTIENESLAYFMARTYLFLSAVGIQDRGLRFRQHLDTELAHYADDCWDAEVECSYGWVECVGHADRSAFDLTRHGEASHVPLVASDKLLHPRVEEYIKVDFVYKNIPSEFGKLRQKMAEAVDGLSERAKMDGRDTLNRGDTWTVEVAGVRVPLEASMVKMQTKTRTITEEPFVPAVIEPSFGIGRIIHCILEHSYRERLELEGKQLRTYLALPVCIAPWKCSVLTISANPVFEEMTSRMQGDLSRLGLPSKVDVSSASVGKRYARTDELGIPFGITIDFQSVKDGTVTLRERDSLSQLRMAAEEAPSVVGALAAETMTWLDACVRYPAFVEQDLAAD
eukprot:Polyplicarium_translucidae@DN1067_c0_g1_i1.p1